MKTHSLIWEGLTALLVGGGLCVSSTVFSAASSTDADWISLNLGIRGANQVVYAATADANGNVYVGGCFTFIRTGPANAVAKWDGTRWSGLGSGVGACPILYYNSVHALTASGDDLYVGGYFQRAGAVAANYIAKWDGGAWSPLGSGMSLAKIEVPTVKTLAISGNDLYAGGSFCTAGGKWSPGIARAYLLPLPELSVIRSGPEVRVSWPSADTADFTLEQTAMLGSPTTWTTNTATITDDGTTKSVTVPPTNTAQVFRLRRP